MVMVDGPSRLTKVYFGIPCGSGKVVCDFAISLFRTAEIFKEKGIGSEIHYVLENSNVDLARGIIVSEFLKSDATHLMQLDDDIGWDGEDIVRMIYHDVDMCGGVYPMKKPEPEFRVKFNEERRLGLIGADWTPGGFCLIKRHVIEGMMLEFSDLMITGGSEYPEKFVCLHKSHVEDGRYWGEDTSFCKRLRAAGYKLWIDPTISLRHWSGTTRYDHTLMGNLVHARRS